MLYDIHQIAFAFSLASNSASGWTGNPTQLEYVITKKVDDYIDKYFKPENDGWTFAWGPVVWQAPKSNISDNAMMVLRNQKDEYIVAVAATNGNSIADWDWIHEDLAVEPAFLQPLPGQANGEKMISKGTYTGVQTLMNMLDPTTKTTLSQFLSSVTGKTLIFSGHSLAGALTPVLALCLYPNGSEQNWDNIYVLPSAGASPGTQAFADLFAHKYPIVGNGKDYKTWNAVIRNSLDIVPHSWQTDQLKSIISLYTVNSLEVRVIIDALVVAAVTLSSVGKLSANDSYRALQNIEFPSKQTSGISNKDEFESEVYYQHVNAYYPIFHLPPPPTKELPSISVSLLLVK